MTETKTKIPLTHKMYLKVTAFILCVIFFSTAFLTGVMGTFVALNLDMYTKSESFVTTNFLNGLAYEDTQLLLSDISYNEKGGIANYCKQENIYSFVCKERNKTNTYANYRSNQPYQNDKPYFTYTYSGIPLTVYTQDSEGNIVEEENQDILVDVEIKVLVENNKYAFWRDILVFLYSVRYTVLVVGVICFILSILCFVFLMCSSGHRAGSTKILPSWGTKIPLDLLAGGLFLLIVTLIAIIDESIQIRNATDGIFWIIIILFLVIVCSITGIGFCMSFALRWKLGRWWKNTLIYRILHLLAKVIRTLWHWTVTFFRNLPLIWKTVLIVVGILFYEFFCMLFCDAMGGYYPMLGFFLFLEKVILTPFVCYIALCLRKFQQHTQQMADGEFTNKMSDNNLIGDFKAYAHTLNNISNGMTVAVEQRMKSERMKTELITNVSHDIKTPLTSIINYSDLISREKSENPQINEYAEVLSRQSAKLKRLIEDLVEASKASTGNIEINLTPCEANIFMVQTVGEFGEKLAQKQLELITSSPDYPIRIMADGRRLWRVFDNLMNNICKYSQSHTRVYIALEKTENQAVFVFKNTSHLPLNMSADELMERFVRGDSSRSTEGNGLGLSIAKSLTELQNGKFTLITDGDLFKVILKFPVISDMEK